LLRALVILLSLSFASSSFAQITEAEIDALVDPNRIPADDVDIEALVKRAEERQSALMGEAERAVEGSYSVEDAVRDEYGLDLSGPSAVAGEDTLYVFISFSMPDAMIRQYLQDALKYRGRVVIRGLINGSMMETTTKLASLIEKDEERSIGAVIDPRAFEAFGITKVPAIALSEFPLKRCETDDCVMEVGRFDVIYGSVSVQYALEQFAGRGDVKKIATAQLGYQR